MRLWAMMLVVILIIIVGGVYVERSILKTTDRLSEEIDLLKEYVEGEQWEEAVSLCGAIDRYWSKQQEKWGPFIHNHELDVIAEDLARMVSLLESKAKSDLLAEIAVVKVRMVQLHHQEILTIQNIF